jgi:hypothetical protein
MSGEFVDSVDIASKIATVGAFIVTASTFGILYRRTTKSEEYRIASDISKSLTELEHKILAVPSEDVEQKLLRHKQYLNVWEWFAFLVNHDELKNKKILEYFKPTFLSDYKEYSEMFPELKSNGVVEFRELRRLYQKWMKA